MRFNRAWSNACTPSQSMLLSPPIPLMKTTHCLFLGCAVLAPAILSAASFEGKVSFKMTSGRDKPMEMTYNIKGDKIRMETPAQKGMGGMIMDTSKREMTMIMDEQKSYMVMALPQAAVDAIAKRDDEVKLEKTSETEKILGYTATKYILTDKSNAETELWLAEGLGTFMGFNKNPMGRGRGSAAASPAWERALEGKELFPLRVISYEKGNQRSEKGKSSEKSKGKSAGTNESFRMEVTAIDKTPLPDSLFNPPAGYQKFDMGGMMKGMIPGR
jgi:hypothetical protein